MLANSLAILLSNSLSAKGSRQKSSSKAKVAGLSCSSSSALPKYTFMASAGSKAKACSKTLGAA